MFFLLSKILGFFALPSNLAATIVAIGVALLFTRWRIAGRRLAALGVVLLLVAGFSPLGNALIYPLEERFPAWDASGGAPDGIVVLGGAIGPDISAARHTPDLNESAERLTAVAVRARRSRQRASSTAAAMRASCSTAASRPTSRSRCSRASVLPARASSSNAKRATPSRMQPSARNWWIRNPASAGCWSPPAITCRVPSGCFAAPDSRSRLF